ncbi:hypothetical protein ACTHPH_21850 [Paenibacillus pasadenensis]
MSLAEHRFPSGRVGYAVDFREFELTLELCKSYPFDVPDFEPYKARKRPIIRQFLDTNETHFFLNEIGDRMSIFTTKRHLREKKMPHYTIERKRLIPIVSLIRRYELPIDDRLNRMISDAIEEPYEFML